MGTFIFQSNVLEGFTGLFLFKMKSLYNWMRFFFYSVFAIVNINSTQAFSADSNPTELVVLTNDSIHMSDSLATIIVYANKFGYKISGVGGLINSIDPEKHRMLDPLIFPEILNSIPGVLMQSGSFSTSRLTIRGFGSRSPYGSTRVSAFWNDIPLSSGDGTTILEDIDPQFAEKIHIVKGSHSEQFGSGMGGSIVLSDQDTNTDSKLLLNTGLGTFNFVKAFFKSKIILSNGSITAGFSGQKATGYRQNSSHHRNSALFSGHWGKIYKLDYLIHLSDVKAFIPSSLNKEMFLSKPSSAASNWLNVKGHKKYQRFLSGLHLESPINQFFKNHLSLSLNVSNPYEVRPFNILDDQSKVFSISDFIVFKTTQLGFSLGGDYQIESYQWKLLQNSDLTVFRESHEIRTQSNVYSSFQWFIFEKIRFSFGANLNRTVYTSKDIFESDSLNFSSSTPGRYHFSPKAGLVFQNNSYHSFFVSASNSFSNPTVEESLDSRGYLNETLRPEQAWNLDLGTRLFFPEYGVQFQLSVYHIWLMDLLVTQRDTEEVFYGKNAGNAHMYGLESSILWKAGSWFQTNINFYTSKNRFTDNKQSSTLNGKNLPGIPVYIFSPDAIFSLPGGLRIEARMMFQGMQYLNDLNTEEYKGWTTTDIHCSYNLQFSKIKFEIQSGIKNLFDERYASMVLVNAPSFGNNPPRYYYPALPRNYYFAIHFRL